MTNGMMGFTSHYLNRLDVALQALDRREVDEAIGLIRKVWMAGGQVITLGNGGSAMTALHFVTDWNKAIFLASGRPFRGRSLVDNMGIVTAYSNDVEYADVFVEQLKNLATRDDLVLAVSGSGNSENIIRAIDYANSTGAQTLGLTGYSGGRLKTCAKHVVWARVCDMQLCEDIHAIFGHIVMQALCGSMKSEVAAFDMRETA